MRVSVQRRAFVTVLAVLSLGTVGARAAHAFAHQRDNEHGSALAAGETLAPAVVAQLPNRRSLTLAEAVMIAQNRYPGRVLRAQTIQQGNGAVHEVRIIGNDGTVHTVRVDARTGAVQ